MDAREFEMVAQLIAETDRHEAADAAYAEGWHAALAALRVRVASEYLRRQA